MKIALFGGGPACLMAAFQLCEKHEVHIFEKGKRIGRKFLVAGNGGFNLTNEAVGAELIAVYSNHPKLHQSLLDFDSTETRKWLNRIGVDTYVGSSGRIFPKKGIKPANVLQKLKKWLEKKGVHIHLNHEFVGFDSHSKPIVRSVASEYAVEADHYIFGLGGGSWSKTGANAQWLVHFDGIGVKTCCFQPSNCGVDTRWNRDFQDQFGGQPLKNIAINIAGASIKGEALITGYGLEGNAIYPLIPLVRESLSSDGAAELRIDFKPNSTVEMLHGKIPKSTVKPKNYQHIFNINKAIQEMVKSALTKSAYLDPFSFANALKDTPIPIHGLRPIDEAISTVGGIDMNEIDSNFRLKRHPNMSTIGEMLDWDAPTGGFLLQACFSTGYSATKLL